MSISFVSINVRGLKNIVKREAIFLFCKEQQANCVFLQETHSGTEDENFGNNNGVMTSFFHMELLTLLE